MKLIVDHIQRHAKMRAHTATHLMHFALGELLWSTKQAGSLVDEDYLRFDFAAKQPLTAQEIQTIESKVNHRIRNARDVNVKEMNHDEALKTWAKAFFEDKYGDVVRVVSVIDNDISLSSVELCGWTHVKNTADIWAFLITGQEAVASGIRRLTAVTWPAVAVHAQTLSNELLSLSTKLDCQPKQLAEKIDKLIKEHAYLQWQYEGLQAYTIQSAFKKISETPNKIEGFSIVLNISDNSALAATDFKLVASQAKNARTDKNWIIYTNEGNYAIGTWEKDVTAKGTLQKYGLKWGGSDHFVQWRDPKILEII